MWNGLVADELGRHFRVVGAGKVDEGTLVPHGVAVVGCGEDGDALAVVADLVPVVLDLVAPHDVVQLVVR